MQGSPGKSCRDQTLADNQAISVFPGQNQRPLQGVDHIWSAELSRQRPKLPSAQRQKIEKTGKGRNSQGGGQEEKSCPGSNGHVMGQWVILVR